MRRVTDNSVLNRLNQQAEPDAGQSVAPRNKDAAARSAPAPSRQPAPAPPSPTASRVRDEETVSILNLPSGEVESLGDFEINAADAMERAKRYTPNLAETLQEQATSRSTFTTIGATAGSVIGAPLGLGGVFGGGGLGASIGSSIYDYVELINNPESAPQDFVQTQIKNAAREGVNDAAISTGANAAFTLAGQLGSRILGIGKEPAQRLLEAGKRRGIGLGAFYLQEGVRQRAVNAASRIAGPFPLAGAGFKAAQRNIDTQYINSLGRFLDDMAPSATTFGLSARSAASAKQTYKRYRGIYDALYQNVERVVGAFPRQDVFFTRSIKGQSQNILDYIKGASPTTRAGKRTKSRNVSTEVRTFIEEMSNLSDRQSLEQLKTIKQDAAALMESDGVTDTAKRYLEQIRISAEQSMSDIDTSLIPREQAEEAIGALTTANKFFTETMGQFKTPTAQQFKQYDQNIFRAGRTKPGQLNVDELFNSIINTNSRVGLQNLRFLVQRSGARDPDRIYQGLVRKHLEGIFDNARRSSGEIDNAKSRFTFDYEKLRSQIDLTDPDKKAFYDQMFRGTNYSTQAMDDFLEIARKADGAEVPSASTFIARRMALGGVASGLTAVSPAGGSGASVALILGLNGIQSVLTNPGLARRLSRLSDLSPETFAFRALGTRLAEDLMIREDQDQEAPQEVQEEE